MSNRLVVVEDNKVTNVIIGNYDQIAFLFPEGSLVEETEATRLAWLGARWNGVRFESIKIYPSWVWNEETFEYDPPSPKPGPNYFWNETEQVWVEILPQPIPTHEELIASGMTEEQAQELINPITGA